MKNTEALIEAITAEKILPLFRKQPLETVLKVTNTWKKRDSIMSKSQWKAKTSPQSLQETKQRFPNVQVGAGTVKTVEDAKRAVDAGVAFIVTPNFSEAVIEYVAGQQIPYHLRRVYTIRNI